MKSPALINTTEIRPCPQLQPFVRCFTYRELLPIDCKINRPLFATSDFIISINLTEKKFGFVNPEHDNRLPPTEQLMNSLIVITGVASQFTGVMSSDGYARIFSIYFTPTGFFRLFGIPAIHFANIIEEDVYTCNKNLLYLREQLMGLTDNIEMAGCCEKFLLRQLAAKKIKHPYEGILFTSEAILHNANHYPIERMAYDANMSMKTFERRFIEQVGCPPKLFSRIVRFNRAIALKMDHFQKSWTDIAHTCGYYDQMHFIKECKLFSGTTPTDFFKNMPPVAENFTASSLGYRFLQACVFVSSKVSAPIHAEN